MTGDEMPLARAGRIRGLNGVLGDLQARIPQVRRDLAELAGASPVDDDVRLGAVEAVLRRRFGDVLEVPDGWWRATAQECVDAAETGI